MKTMLITILLIILTTTAFGADFFNSLDRTATVSAKDPAGVVAVQLSFDGKTWLKEVPFPEDGKIPFEFPADTPDGMVCLWARFKDKPGTWGESHSACKILDRVGPSGTIDFNGLTINVTINNNGD